MVVSGEICIPSFVHEGEANTDWTTVESFGEEWTKFSSFSEKDIAHVGSDYFTSLSDQQDYGRCGPMVCTSFGAASLLECGQQENQAIANPLSNN